MNQIARITIAARWLNSLARHAPEWIASRGRARQLYRQLLRLEEAFQMIERDAEWLLGELNASNIIIYETPDVVAFVKRRDSVIVIDEFIAPGLDYLLSRIDTIAERFRKGGLLRETAHHPNSSR